MSNVWIPGNHLKIEALSCQNVTEKVNFNTDVSELQDEARPKSIAPFPTAQTNGENWWKQLVKIGEQRRTGAGGGRAFPLEISVRQQYVSDRK